MSGPPGPSGRDVSTKVEEEQKHESKHTEFLNFHFFESRDQGPELLGEWGRHLTLPFRMGPMTSLNG